MDSTSSSSSPSMLLDGFRPRLVGLIVVIRVSTASTGAKVVGGAANVAFVEMFFVVVIAIVPFVLAFTIIFYGLIYTVWLKRSTVQNIVIGGAAGALPPVIGWAAVTGAISIEPIVLFCCIFFWTPPHFWALALVKNDDYIKANIPMLPAVNGVKETKRQIFIYSLIMYLFSLLPYLIGTSKILYGFIACFAGIIFVALSFQLFRKPNEQRSIRLFKYSIVYLFVVFFALISDRAILG